MTWLLPQTALVAVHLLANVVWIGSILAVAVLVGGAKFMAEPSEAGMLARRVYLRLAVPAFLASFLAGAGRLYLSPVAYLHMPWMHVKLTLALLVIILHHAIGARARRVASGMVPSGQGVGVLAGALFLGVAGAVLLAVNKSLP
jgi:protoporphyrinogen IX oxidase